MLLYPRPPFDLDLTMSVLTRSAPRAPDYVVANSYRRVLRHRTDCYLTEVRSLGTVDRPAINIRLLKPVTTRALEPLAEQIRWMFSIDFDLTPFYDLLESEEQTRNLKRKLHGLKLPRYPTLFEAVVSAIIEQQISAAAASTLKARLVRLGDAGVVYEGLEYFAFPSASTVASLPVAALRGLGLPRRKAQAIKTVSQLVASGDLDLGYGTRTTAGTTMDKLRAIRGIGPWTTKYVRCRGGGDYTVLPVEDLALRRGIQMEYGPGYLQRQDDIAAMLSRFGEYSGYAAYYFINSYVRRERRVERIPDAARGHSIEPKAC